MRITILVLLCAVALGGGRRHGRRLFQNIERKPRPAAAVAAPRKEPAPEAEPAPLTANRTIGLLRERELLQDRVAAIDRALAADRDQKRRDLTAQYEREMRELEDDWGAGAAPARASPSPELNGALRQQVSAALASYRQPPRGSELPHQDVEHQVDPSFTRTLTLTQAVEHQVDPTFTLTWKRSHLNQNFNPPPNPRPHPCSCSPPHPPPPAPHPSPCP